MVHKNVRIALQLQHKDDSVSSNSGTLAFGDYQWDELRYLHHANGNNEWVMFKDAITDKLDQIIKDIINISGNNPNADPSLIFLYQFDKDGNAYYSDEVNAKWKEWMKANYRNTKPTIICADYEKLHYEMIPMFHSKCVMTTVRFTGDVKDYDDIGKLTEALIGQFVNQENNITFRVVSLYDKCMKVAHELHLLDINQDSKINNIWCEYSDSSALLDEIVTWLESSDYYQAPAKKYILDLSRMSSDYWYRYNFVDDECTYPVILSTVAYEQSGEYGSYTSFSDSYSNTSVSGGESGLREFYGNDSMLLVQSGSVLSISTTVGDGNIKTMGVTIRIINLYDDSKYIEKHVTWNPNDGLGGGFTKTWSISKYDINALGGECFVRFAINNKIQRNTRGASMFSIVKLTGRKKSSSVLGELTHTKNGLLMDSFINISEKTDIETSMVRPDLNLDTDSSYSNPGNQYSTTFETPVRGDSDHRVNRVQGSVTITGMRPETEWTTSPTLKTDVLCYTMSGTLAKTLSAQYGHSVIGGTKTAENKGNWKEHPGPWDRQMNCEATFDIGGQEILHIGVNSNVIIKYNRDHHDTQGTTMRRYDGTMMSGTKQGWREGGDHGTDIGIPQAPNNVDVSSIDGVKKSNLYVAVNIKDIPNDGAYKQFWTRHVDNYVAGNMYAYLYVKRTGLKATILFRYSWQDGGNHRDIHRRSFYTKMGLYTPYPSSNVLLLQPSDNGKTFNFDFNLGGFYKVVIKNTASWGIYGTGSYGTLSSFKMTDVCTGEVTYYLPEKSNVPMIFNPKNVDCTILLKGGSRYEVMSQAQNMRFDQLGVISINKNPIDIQYVNTKYYGRDLILSRDFILTGKTRSYKFDVVGKAPSVTHIASGVPDIDRSINTRSMFFMRKNLSPYEIKPDTETGMGLISKINLVRKYRLDEVPNKYISIITKENEEIKFKIEYAFEDEWVQLYSDKDNYQRVYAMIVNSTWLYILTYHINVKRINLYNIVGNTLELVLRDSNTGDVTHSFSLMEDKTDNCLPVEYDGRVYYVAISDKTDDVEPVTLYNETDNIVGYLK